MESTYIRGIVFECTKYCRPATSKIFDYAFKRKEERMNGRQNEKKKKIMKKKHCTVIKREEKKTSNM